MSELSEKEMLELNGGLIVTGTAIVALATLFFTAMGVGIAYYAVKTN